MESKDAPPPYSYPPQQPGYPQHSPYPQQQQPYAQPGYGAPAPYPVQAYPAQPAPGMAHNTTIITQPQATVMLPMVFGEFPVPMSCPHCRAQIVSATCYDTGSFTWVIAGILCLVGCWPCCLIPFCVDGCKDVTHSCPNCQRVLGVYHRM